MGTPAPETESTDNAEPVTPFSSFGTTPVPAAATHFHMNDVENPWLVHGLIAYGGPYEKLQVLYTVSENEVCDLRMRHVTNAGIVQYKGTFGSSWCRQYMEAIAAFHVNNFASTITRMAKYFRVT